MTRYVWWRPFAVVLVLLIAAVAIAKAEGNPDGPVGAVMFEPSIGFSGTTFYDGLSVFPYDDDDDWDFVSERGREALDYTASGRHFGLNVLVPVKPNWTFGANYAYTRGDWDTGSRLGKTENEFGSWNLAFRVRYWWIPSK